MTIATKVHHIGIAVKNLDETLQMYTAVLSLKPDDYFIDPLPGGGRAAMIRVGESLLELLECNDPESMIGKFINAKGEGIHHIAVGVKNVKQQVASLQKKGIPLQDKAPKPGALGTMIVFIDPKATGILLELVEE